MPNVSAPYNFVPLNKDVFFPPWANFVNHDIPFKEGLSGKIDLKITAESPIFIRGVEEVNHSNNEFKQYRFPKYLDRYYIPGSSLKGEISNILEILSFSKLRFFNDVKYSQREWRNETLYNKQDFANVKGGWLSLNGEGNYLIEYSNQKPGRIKHNELNKIKDEFSDTYSHDGFDKDARHKYKLTDCIDDDSNNITFIEKKFICQYIQGLHKNVCTISENGNVGKIVFTGQSSIRNENAQPNRKGKGYEFVFWETVRNETLTPNDIRIKSFKTAYDDGDLKKESIDWKMWKKQLKNGEKVPIFITETNGQIEHFGLSMLYKLPYKKSIKEIIDIYSNKQHFDVRKDFVETLFGNIEDSKLKGRVHFGHCFSENASESNKMFTANLGSPKPTYYPFYIQQNFKEKSTEIIDDYFTYNDGKIAGRKRYPIRNIVNNLQQDQQPNKTTTSFYPLEANAIFNGSITFHNLLPEELGALLSALTFHNQNDNFKHSIGMAKPLGLGKCDIAINNIFIENEKIEDSNLFINGKLCLFEKLMSQFNNDWLASKQLTELFAIATPVSAKLEQLAYMTLSINPQINDFSDIKNLPKKALPRYSKFMGISPKIKSQINDDCQLRVDSPESIHLENIFDELKKSKITEFVSRKNEIIIHINNINTSKIKNEGVNNFIKNYSKYGVLIGKINEYKNRIGLSESEILPESDFKHVIKQLDFIYNKMNNKKKKLFNNNSKKTTISSWIGQENTKNWFKSKF